MLNDGKAELVDGVTFDGNGGTGKMAAQALPKGTALSPNTFTRTGHIFKGWNTKAVDADCKKQPLSTFGLSLPSVGSYKLMLVNGSTYVPLGEAWSEP